MNLGQFRAWEPISGKAPSSNVYWTFGWFGPTVQGQKIKPNSGEAQGGKQNQTVKMLTAI